MEISEEGAQTLMDTKLNHYDCIPEILPGKEILVRESMQEKENHSNIYRALAVLAMIIWLIISVIALVKPSVFREQEGHYQIDDCILYFEDLRWYEFNGNKWIETPEDIERKERI